DARKATVRRFGRSHRRAQGDRSTLRSDRPKRAADRSVSTISARVGASSGAASAGERVGREGQVEQQQAEVVAAAEGGQRRRGAVLGRVGLALRRGPGEVVDGPVGARGSSAGRGRRAGALGGGGQRRVGAGLYAPRGAGVRGEAL